MTPQPKITPYNSISNHDGCIADICIAELFDEEYSNRVTEVAFKEDHHTQPTNQYLKEFISKPIIEVQLAVFALLSSFLVGVGTLQSIPPVAASIAETCEMCILAVFTMEYIIRWKINGFSAKYIVQPLAIIDLLAILPGFIRVAAMTGMIGDSSLTGTLINLRLLRILKLQRELTDYETFKKFELALGLNPSGVRPYQLQLARVVISIFTLLSVTSGLIYTAEHAVNPNIPDYFTAVYFCLTTLTTVGFGDIHPATNAGRWIVSGAILIGSAVVPAQAAALIEALLARDGNYRDQRQQIIEPQSLTASMNSSFGSCSNDNAQVGDEISSTSLAARLERVEQKIDDSNERMNLVLVALEKAVNEEKKL